MRLHYRKLSQHNTQSRDDATQKSHQPTSSASSPASLPSLSHGSPPHHHGAPSRDNAVSSPSSPLSLSFGSPPAYMWYLTLPFCDVASFLSAARCSTETYRMAHRLLEEAVGRMFDEDRHTAQQEEEEAHGLALVKMAGPLRWGVFRSCRVREWFMGEHSEEERVHMMWRMMHAWHTGEAELRGVPKYLILSGRDDSMVTPCQLIGRVMHPPKRVFVENSEHWKTSNFWEVRVQTLATVHFLDVPTPAWKMLFQNDANTAVKGVQEHVCEVFTLRLPSHFILEKRPRVGQWIVAAGISQWGVDGRYVTVNEATTFYRERSSYSVAPLWVFYFYCWWRTFGWMFLRRAAIDLQWFAVGGACIAMCVLLRGVRAARRRARPHHTTECGCEILHRGREGDIVDWAWAKGLKGSQVEWWANMTFDFDKFSFGLLPHLSVGVLLLPFLTLVVHGPLDKAMGAIGAAVWGAILCVILMCIRAATIAPRRVWELVGILKGKRAAMAAKGAGGTYTARDRDAKTRCATRASENLSVGMPVIKPAYMFLFLMFFPTCVAYFCVLAFFWGYERRSGSRRSIAYAKDMWFEQSKIILSFVGFYLPVLYSGMCRVGDWATVLRCQCYQNPHLLSLGAMWQTLLYFASFGIVFLCFYLKVIYRAE